MVNPHTAPLSIADGRAWHFINGAWEDGQGTSLTVPEALRRAHGHGIQGHHYAFYRPASYGDVHARFEFRLTSHSDTGLILRAQDASHFYLVHFPNCGQASRAQHFWVAFSKMDASGYLKLIKLDMVRRVPSNNDIWLTADVRLTGPRLTVRIGDHGIFEADDDTYPDAGHIGVYSFGKADIRDIQIDGTPGDTVGWDDGVEQPVNWFHPQPDDTAGIWQRPADLLRFPDGELLLSYGVQAKAFKGTITHLLSRSVDSGHTWSAPVTFPTPYDPGWEPDRLHLTPGGRLIYFRKTPDGYRTAVSPDRGHTWSDPTPTGFEPAPPGLTSIQLPPQAALNLADGSILVMGYGRRIDVDTTERNIRTWGAFHCQAFTCVSRDDGATWSVWTNVDNAGFDNNFDPNEPDRPLGRPIDGNMDLTEMCTAQMGNGRVMGLIRPIYSPWMWETWSTDNGATWGPCVRGPFPGYATPNMLRTSSGAVLVAHRLPSHTVHVSRDDGHTWDQGTLIDSAIWAMGAMVEIEPDLVLYVYWDSYETLMRAQLIRVTATSLEPIRLVTG